MLKCMCIASNLVFQVSPLPIAREFQDKGDTGEMDSAPFVSVAFSCSQFSFYGLFAYIATGKSGFLVLVYSNAMGMVMGYYYVYAFVRNCQSFTMWQQTSIYLKAIGCVMIVQLGCIISLPTGRALLLVGLVSSGCSFISATSLVTSVPEVIRTGCSKSLPRPVLACAQFSSLLWVACGVTLGDEYIIAPNVCSLFITTFALMLSWYYPKTLTEEEEVSDGKPASTSSSKLASPAGYGALGFSRATPRGSAPLSSAGTSISLSSADGETGGTPIPPAMWPPEMGPA